MTATAAPVGDAHTTKKLSSRSCRGRTVDRFRKRRFSRIGAVMSHNRDVTNPSVFDRQKSRKPIDLGIAGSVVFVPLLFIVGGLSIPYSFCNRYLSARRERDFSKAMLGRNRTIPWPAFVTQMNSGVGTLILESASIKGPVRWWWTSQTLSTTLSALLRGGQPGLAGRNWRDVGTPQTKPLKKSSPARLEPHFSFLGLFNKGESYLRTENSLSLGGWPTSVPRWIDS